MVARLGDCGEIFLLRMRNSAILQPMEFDPHTLQQILHRIYQQMRCPQCGKKVPVDLGSIQVVSEEAMLLQLRCEDCNAYIVLQASLQGIDALTAPPYEANETANASSDLQINRGDLETVRHTLSDVNGSFKDFFETQQQKQSLQKNPQSL
jgi:hypothetical protein